MAKDYPLVVVDMQYDFFCSLEDYWDSHVVPFISRVKRKVRLAVTEGRPIIILEYSAAEQTFEEIRYEITKDGHYPFAKFVKKSKNDGGDLCLARFDQAGLDVGHVEILGVNLDFCVAETAMTISTRHKCKIVSSCTANANYPDKFERDHNYILHPPPIGDIRSVLATRPPELKSGWNRTWGEWNANNIEVV